MNSILSCRNILLASPDGALVMVKMGRVSGINQQPCLAHGVHLAVVAVLYSKNTIPIYDEGTDEEPNGTSQIQSTISDSNNDGLCGAEDTEGEFIFSDEDNGEIDEDVYISPLKINIKTVIVKFRNIVRIFRKSPLKNEVLQSYIKEDLGKTLNLVMDCKTRWNSLINKISRLLTVRKPLCKAMIDINLKMEICELDWQVLENICSCLKPIEMGISALCQRDANLLSAEGIFDFMFQKLEMVGSDFALELLQNLRQRFNERRQSNLINVMKYLLNPDSIREDPCIKRKEVQKTMRIILSQLYSQHGTEQSDNVIVDYQKILEDIEDVEMHSSPILLTDQLKRAIQKSTTHVRTPKEDIGFLFLIKEMALFEATGDKSKIISSIEEVLNTIPPTSAEAERVFSAAGLFVTKLRSRLSENSVDSLTDYCRSVTIVTKTKTTFFTRKMGQLHPKTGQFRHFFGVKNVVNFSNSSRQYSVNDLKVIFQEARDKVMILSKLIDFRISSLLVIIISNLISFDKLKYRRVLAIEGRI